MSEGLSWTRAGSSCSHSSRRLTSQIQCYCWHQESSRWAATEEPAASDGRQLDLHQHAVVPQMFRRQPTPFCIQVTCSRVLLRLKHMWAREGQSCTGAASWTCHGTEPLVIVLWAVFYAITCAVGASKPLILGSSRNQDTGVNPPRPGGKDSQTRRYSARAQACGRRRQDIRNELRGTVILGGRWLDLQFPPQRSL